MRLEIYNGEHVGTAEWLEPGRVELDVPDAHQRTWFERYFEGEDAFLTGLVGSEEMALERRDSSPEAFARAAFHLAAYSYRVRDAQASHVTSPAGDRPEHGRAEPLAHAAAPGGKT